MKYAVAEARRISRALERLPIPEDTRGMALERLDRDAGNDFALDGATSWLADYKRHFKGGDLPGRGLLLYGPPGTGKTLIATSVLQALVAKGARGWFVRSDTWRNLKGEEMTAQQAWQKFNDEDAYQAWLELQERLRSARRSHVLVLDDVGTEHGSEYTARALTELLRYRYGKGRPTIVTSNLPPHEWGTDYGAATESFLEQAFDVLPVAGADRRRR